jgi:hypothetical protein
MKNKEVDKLLGIAKSKIKGIGRFFLMILTALLSYFNFLLLIKIGNDYKVWELLRNPDVVNTFADWSMLIIAYPLIANFLLISLTAICFVAFKKKGFNKIKSYSEKGMIFWLIEGMIFGMIFGMIGGMIFGMIGGVIGEMIFGMIFGMIAEFNEK